MKRNTRIPLVLAAVALAGNSAALADWPHFRGPLGNGTAPAADAGPAWADPAITWQVDLPGEGLSSPLVLGDKVIVTSSSGLEQDTLHVLAFSAADGSRIWERRIKATGRTMHHEKTSVAAPTPTSDGEAIYALYSCGDLIAIDLDGNVRWIRALGLDYPNASISLGFATSPLATGGAVVVQLETDSQSVAVGLDPADSRTLWEAERAKKANWSSPVPYDEGRLALLQGSAGLDAVLPATGEVLWSTGEGASTTSSATYSAEGTVFVPSKGLTALSPPTEPKGPPKELWSSTQLAPRTVSPLVVGDQIYTINGTGVLTAANTSDGERNLRLRLEGPFSGSPVASGTRLYVFSEKGIGQGVDLTLGEEQELRTIELEEMILCTPALSGGALYVRSDKRLWRIDG